MSEIRSFIRRGALSGATGGTVAALFQWLVTENQIKIALAIEAAGAGPGGDEMFSRGTQVLGGMLAAVLYGTFLGVVFGITLAALRHRMPGSGEFGRAMRLGGAAFVTWSLVPALKYPANPPAVGDPETVGQRTVAYLALLVASIVLTCLAWACWRALSARGVVGPGRFAATGAFYLGGIALAYLIWPANPDPLEVPANLIWHFRVDALAGSALLWMVTPVVFGLLAERSRPPAGVVEGDRARTA